VGFTILGLSFAFLLSAGVLILGTNKYMEIAYASNHTFGWIYTAAYILIMLVYFVPTYYLYEFAVELKKSITLNDTNKLTKASRFLKKDYTPIGIFIIVTTVIYLAISVFFLSSVF
jgi:hypothetical protein